MATRPIAPRGDGEGSLGISTKQWGDVQTKKVNGMDVSDLGGVPIGFVAPFTRSTAPDGWLSCAGAEVSRAAYPDLWNYVNGNSSQLISETDWQSKNTSGEKNIGWFSSGDGTTTFRLPRIVGSGELTEVKRFTTAGDGTFVAPVTGIYKITLQGAGGGGASSGNATGYGYVGGGGGAAGARLEFYEQLTAGTTYSFTVGAGGTGGAANGANGTNGGLGGNSEITIANNTYVAGGGGNGLAALTYHGRGGLGGIGTINGIVVCKGVAGGKGTTGGSTYANGGVGGGVGGANVVVVAQNYEAMYGGGGAGGDYSGVFENGSAGGDGYIEFAYNPVPQYWYVRAFGSATNQGTVDITELANMLNAKLNISDVPKIAGFNAKQTFTTSGTFVAPVTGIYKITLQGGGGGGAGIGKVLSGSDIISGGGGGQGGYLEFYEKLIAGTTYNYTIGAGGTGGAAGVTSSPTNGGSGGTGGASSITVNGNVYTCNGGNGGKNASNDGAGGTGGTSTINNTTYYNALCGGAGLYKVSNYVIGGNGGGAGGTAGIYYTYNGRSGSGGTGGGYDSLTYYKGGAGGDGFIAFEWLDTSLL